MPQLLDLIIDDLAVKQQPEHELLCVPDVPMRHTLALVSVLRVNDVDLKDDSHQRIFCLDQDLLNCASADVLQRMRIRLSCQKWEHNSQVDILSNVFFVRLGYPQTHPAVDLQSFLELKVDIFLGDRLDC